MLYNVIVGEEEDKLDQEVVSEAEDEQTPDVEETVVAAPAPAAKPGKKPGTPKEVPPFRWKIVGYSQGIPLTLFKSVEEADSEAQLPRYREEGYYSDLAIYPLDKKIPVPKDVVLAPHAKPKPVETKRPAKKRLAKKKAPPAAKPKPAKKPTAKKKTVGQKAAAPKKKAPKTAAKTKPKAKGKTAAKKTAKGKAKSAKAQKAKSSTRKSATRKRATR